MEKQVVFSMIVLPCQARLMLNHQTLPKQQVSQVMQYQHETSSLLHMGSCCLHHHNHLLNYAPQHSSFLSAYCMKYVHDSVFSSHEKKSATIVVLSLRSLYTQMHRKSASHNRQDLIYRHRCSSPGSYRWRQRGWHSRWRGCHYKPLRMLPRDLDSTWVWPVPQWYPRRWAINSEISLQVWL